MQAGHKLVVWEYDKYSNFNFYFASDIGMLALLSSLTH